NSQRILAAGISTACVGLIALGMFLLYIPTVLDRPDFSEDMIDPAPPRPGQESANTENGVEEVIVSGIRSSLEKSTARKREAQGIVSAITAEDIGKFPDTDIAESLQRMRGIAIDQDSS